jgi:Phosphate-selective porin O and P
MAFLMAGAIASFDAAAGQEPDLRQIAEEMKKLRQEVQDLRNEVAQLKGDAKKVPPALENQSRERNSTFLQFQYQDQQNSRTNPRPNDGFAMRRARFGQQGQLGEGFRYQLTAEFGAGAQRQNTELRDAILFWEPSEKWELQAGQYRLPLGFDLTRSSAAREFPERAAYVNTFFGGERIRGLGATFQIDPKWSISAGLSNSLTTSDPQQTEIGSFRNVSGTRPAGTLGVRYQEKNAEIGVSGFLGYRNDLTFTPTGGAPVTTDGAPREFLFLDARVNPFRRLELRGELMLGRDRTPTFRGAGASRSTTTEFSSKRGYQLQAIYSVDALSQIGFRTEFLDPNDSPNDNLLGYGFLYSRMLSPKVRLSLSYEIFREQGFDQTNNLTTLRLQYRF